MSVDFDKIQKEFDALLNSDAEKSHDQLTSQHPNASKTDEPASVPAQISTPSAPFMDTPVDDLSGNTLTTEHSTPTEPEPTDHSAMIHSDAWQADAQQDPSSDAPMPELPRDVNQLNSIDELSHLDEHSPDGSTDGDLLGGLLDEINVSHLEEPEKTETQAPADIFPPESIAKPAEPATEPAHSHEDSDQKSSELLSILDEIDNPQNIAAASTADDFTDHDIPDDPNDYSTTTATLEKEPKKPYVLVGLAMAILTAGIGYYITNPGSTDHSAGQPDNIIIDTTSTAIKPVPVPTPSAPAPAASATPTHTASKPSSDTVASAAKPMHMIPAPAAIHKPAQSSKHIAPTSNTPDISPITIHLKIDPVSRKVVSPTHAQRGAGWAVNLVSLSSQSDAKAAMNQLKAKGFHPEVVTVEIGNHVFYRVRIPGFSSKKAANQAQALFKSDPEYADAWVNHYRN